MSDVIVFEDFGLRIVVNDGVYYALYDSGESAGSFEKRSRLSKAQFDRAIISEQDAYRVLLEME
jgi:hypothetical protein